MTSQPTITLPHHLHERTLALNELDVCPDGAFVLCWLHHAIRDHENPALDAALTIANALAKPVLVYQGLAGNHRFNSDRHHTFIMQGARDLQTALRDRGIAYAFHLPTDPNTPSPLRRLLDRACAFVTEDFPAPPFPRWTAALAECAPCAALAVDSACLMPMRLLSTRYERAFKFRDKAKKEWRARLREAWTDTEPTVAPLQLDPDLLGFEPLDLQHADLDELCARCDIDHSIPPVPQTPGGTDAGYQRWRAFVDLGHLARYDKRRNDPSDPEAVSGLSPYLHHGHVSPMRIGREANDIGGSGADKFLDELLVWRELSYNFCAHTPEQTLESLDALPDWARETLREHKDDRRPCYSWDRLANRQVISWWRTPQQALRNHGAIHNNIRMTWGKMIAQWARSPEEALRIMIDINHRFALDGNNPNSYTGILWCLGGFDRPFEPEQKVLGTVRPRSFEMHLKHGQSGFYKGPASGRTRPPAALHALVIGAGITGLSCAQFLQHLVRVSILDRGRMPGGRMSTRIGDDVVFEHGCPSFTVTDPRFSRYVKSWIDDGVCATWRPRLAEWRDGELVKDEYGPTHIVGTPSFNALFDHLTERGNGIHVSAKAVTSLQRWLGGWNGVLEENFRHSEHLAQHAVVLAMAPEQAIRLLDNVDTPLHEPLARMQSDPQWIAMLTTDRLTQLPQIIDTPDHPVLARIVRDNAKPGRNVVPHTTRFVVHASHAWSRERIDVDRDEIAPALAEAFASVVSTIVSEPVNVQAARAHRWKYARVNNPIPDRCLFDRERGLVVCGEGFGGTGVEAAFLSANAAAGRVLSLRPPTPAWSPFSGMLFQ
ncbi:MAG: NAD(P)-binding protein [Planctomycetota bacterium]